MQRFNIDISQPRGPLVLYVSQGDSLSRFFSVTVTDNGAAYTPPGGAVYTVRFGAPGMPAGWYDTITEVGGSTHPAVVVDENTYTVEIAEQALGTPGENALVLIVSDATGYTLASWAFVLQVAAVPGYDAPEATVYYNALSEQVAQTLANAQAAATSASQSAASATLSESWAVGGTGTREGENTNNSKYWAQQAQSIAGGQLGWYETEQALQAAHPTGENGQWAIIGSTDTIWTWDSDTSAWVNSGAQVDLSNYYTKAQADAAFATAAQGTKADSAVQSVNGKSGTAVTLAPQDVGGLSTYTCATSGTTHALTGAGDNIKFVADAAYNEGDTITVNGTAVTAQTQDGATLADGAWASGATVVCWLDGATLTVSGGGSSPTSGYGALVDITEYTGSTGEHTAYTTPSAGWVTLIAATGSSVATIRDETYPTSGNYLASVFSSPTVGGMATVFVPKGAKIYSTVFSGSVEKMTFVPAQ
ncbi:hypothetical protein [Candidatus Allofournierella excrementavium]|uniref:hypothetical protein n=1 Tax=Candidatus Allofournierella excrementavium TaxID=2838591 RepID=UPI003AB5B01E